MKKITTAFDEAHLTLYAKQDLMYVALSSWMQDTNTSKLNQYRKTLTLINLTRESEEIDS